MKIKVKKIKLKIKWRPIKAYILISLVIYISAYFLISSEILTLVEEGSTSNYGALKNILSKNPELLILFIIPLHGMKYSFKGLKSILNSTQISITPDLITSSVSPISLFEKKIKIPTNIITKVFAQRNKVQITINEQTTWIYKVCCNTTRSKFDIVIVHSMDDFKDAQKLASQINNIINDTKQSHSKESKAS